MFFILDNTVAGLGWREGADGGAQPPASVMTELNHTR